MKLEVKDEGQMQALGGQLARAASAGIVFLHGELGAGKTTLVRGLLRSLGHEGAVKSPTYTLVEHYQLAGREIYHFDLYRLSDPEELDYIGARDYFDGRSLCLIEWPERGHGELPAPDLLINIDYRRDGRTVELIPKTPLGEALARAAAHHTSL